MEESAVFVVVEIISVEDGKGLMTYAQRANALIGDFGGVVIGQGSVPVDGESGFSPLVIQRWTSEAAFRAWLDSEAYRPLRDLRMASATMRVAIVPAGAGAAAPNRGNPGPS